MGMDDPNFKEEIIMFRKIVFLVVIVSLLTACGGNVPQASVAPGQESDTLLLTAIARLNESVEELAAGENCKGDLCTPVPATALPPMECQDEEIPNFDNCTESVPLIDQFGPEEVFPGEVIGPAIAEVWNQKTGFCAIVKVEKDEVLVWDGPGAFWKACSVQALDMRFPHHAAEYLKKYSNCNAVSVGDVNPTK